MKRLSAILTICLLATCIARSQPREVRIGVLGLFHPREVTVTPVPGKPLECVAGEERWLAQEKIRVVLEGATMFISNATSMRAPAMTCADAQGGATGFVVAVPGKLAR